MPGRPTPRSGRSRPWRERGPERLDPPTLRADPGQQEGRARHQLAHPGQIKQVADPTPSFLRSHTVFDVCHQSVHLCSGKQPFNQ